MKKLLLLLFVPVVLNAENYFFSEGGKVFEINVDETNSEAVITTKRHLKCDNNECPKSAEDWKNYLSSSNIFDHIEKAWKTSLLPLDHMWDHLAERLEDIDLDTYREGMRER